MSKTGLQDNEPPFSPPPRYRTPAVMQSQSTGRDMPSLQPQPTGRSQFEFELDDMRQGRPKRPEYYAEADPYYRWRRGVENDMPYRPPRKSKASHIFATCCCASIWGVVAWVAVIVLIMAGATAGIVKLALPQNHQLAMSTVSPSQAQTVTITTSSSSIDHKIVTVHVQGSSLSSQATTSTSSRSAGSSVSKTTSATPSCTPHVDSEKCALITCDHNSNSLGDGDALCTSSKWCIGKERTGDEQTDCLECGCPTLP